MKQSSKALKARTQQQGAAKKAAAGTARHDREHGEGNYKAAREYDRATGAFARSGKVEARGQGRAAGLARRKRRKWNEPKPRARAAARARTRRASGSAAEMGPPRAPVGCSLHAKPRAADSARAARRLILPSSVLQCRTGERTGSRPTSNGDDHEESFRFSSRFWPRACSRAATPCRAPARTSSAAAKNCRKARRTRRTGCKRRRRATSHDTHSGDTT